MENLPPSHERHMQTTHQHWADRVRKAFEQRKCPIPDMDACLKVKSIADVEKLKKEMYAKYMALSHEQSDFDAHHRREKRVQDAFDAISTILGTYSGICEAARSAAGAQAEVPYVAISVLFIVAVNKCAIEKHLAETLTLLKQEFFQVADICESVNYPDLYDTLQSLSENVNVFSQAAAYYYHRRLLGRFPHYNGHFKTVSLTLAARKGEYERDMRIIQRSVFHFTAKELKRTKENQQKMAMAEIEELLDLDPMASEKPVLDVYKAVLLAIKDESNGYCTFDGKDFFKGTPFDEWRSRKTSAIFILHGYSVPAENPAMSWLSLAAFHVKEALEEEVRDKWEKENKWQDKIGAVAFDPEGYRDSIKSSDSPQGNGPYVLHYFFYAHEDRKAGQEAYYLISTLIRQLFFARPDLAADFDWRLKLRRVRKSPKWTEEQPVQPCQFLGELLSAVPETYIVLDGIDLCKCEVNLLVGQLMNMLEEVNSIVKIFAVLGPTQRLSQSKGREWKRDIKLYPVAKDQTLMETC